MLLVSRGTPMLLGGDEFRRTQGGNNNAYCQDNELSWFDWSLVDTHRDLVRFVAGMIRLRKRNPVLRRDAFFGGEVNGRGLPEVAWHGCLLNQPGWQDPQCRVLAFTLGGRDDEADLHVMFNMYDLGLDFEIPQVPGRRWALAADTSRPSPGDIAEPGSELPVDGTTFHVFGRSAVVLVSQPGGTVAP
jgi:isoamylase